MDKLYIWGKTVPGNSTDSKLEKMILPSVPVKYTSSLVKLLVALKEPEYKDIRPQADSFTYSNCILTGKENNTFTDLPYLVPYVVNPSGKSVVIIPGGAFAYKSTDVMIPERQIEGHLMAKRLNEDNINAFILWYRSSPYRFPVPLWDVCRSVRYLKANAEKLCINADEIHLLGFSAGGYLACMHINRMGTSYEATDATDSYSSDVASASYVYPCFDIGRCLSLCSTCFDVAIHSDYEKRKRAVSCYNCSEHVCSPVPPQFLCYGTADQIVPYVCLEPYLNKSRKAGNNIEVVPVADANHGFGSATGRPEISWWTQKYTSWLENN